MITKIEIDGIPPFKEKTGLETEQKVNLIYGLNGTGKTTLSNLLYDTNQTELPTGVNLEYSNGSDSIDSYEIIVYNQRFVKDNFYESSEIKGIFSLSKDNTEAQKAIDSANKVKNELNVKKESLLQQQKDISTEQNNATSNICNELWQIKTTYSGSTSPFDYCLKGYKGDKSQLFEHINKDVVKSLEPPKRSIEDIGLDIVTLKNEELQQLTLLQKYDIQTSEIESNPIFSKVIVGNENSSVSYLINELKNSDWVRQGINFIDNTHHEENQQCPFCQQKTITNDFVKELETYFGGQYEKDIELLKELLEKYKNERKKIIFYEKFDNPLLSGLKAIYDGAYKTLVSDFDKNIAAIEQKITTPSISIKLISLVGDLKNINDIIEMTNQKINEYNKRISQKEAALAELKNEFWNVLRWTYDAKLLAYAATSKRLKEKIDGIDKDLKELKVDIEAQDKIIEENQRKTINVEDAIDNINDALLDMGISDFKIVKYSENMYKLSREGQDGNIFESLSEGEKMIISLLYFIELCKGKSTKESTDKKKIVVIDDPISSLSHIYVYNVGRLIIQEFTDANPTNKNVCKYEQVFLLTHSLYFFYEMAITKRKGKEEDYNQKLFRIQKNQRGSHIIEMQYSEIQNDYQAYWMIIKDNNAAPALIANCMRNIIEYFFAFIEKQELSNVFQKKEMNVPKFKAFNRYINRESHSLGQNIFDIKEFNYDDFKEAFRLVFVLNGYENHYKKMMR